MKARVILFRSSGKYYTQEEWEVPEDAIGPYDMVRSPNFRHIDHGPVLVVAQEPWGYPHIIPTKPSDIVAARTRQYPDSHIEVFRQAGGCLEIRNRGDDHEQPDIVHICSPRKFPNFLTQFIADTP